MHLQKKTGEDNLMMTSAGNLIAINSGLMFIGATSGDHSTSIYCREARSGQAIWNGTFDLENINVEYQSFHIDRVGERIAQFGRVYNGTEWRVITFEYDGTKTVYPIDEFADKLPSDFDTSSDTITVVGFKDDLVYLHLAYDDSSGNYTPTLQCWDFMRTREVDGTIVHGELEFENNSFTSHFTNEDGNSEKFYPGGGDVATDEILYIINDSKPNDSNPSFISVNSTTGSSIAVGDSPPPPVDYIYSTGWGQDWTSGKFFDDTATTENGNICYSESGTDYYEFLTTVEVKRTDQSGWSTINTGSYVSGCSFKCDCYNYPKAQRTSYSHQKSKAFFLTGVETASYNESSGHPWALPDTWGTWATVVIDINCNLIAAYDSDFSFYDSFRVWADLGYVRPNGTETCFKLADGSEKWSSNLPGDLNLTQFITT